MKTMQCIMLFVWFVLTFFFAEIGFKLISMNDSLFNIVGAVIIFSYILISVKTKCLTSFIKKDKKDEKEK